MNKILFLAQLCIYIVVDIRGLMLGEINGMRRGRFYCSEKDLNQKMYVHVRARAHNDILSSKGRQWD